MIGRIQSLVRQLRGRSSHELYTRAAQQAHALGERAALRMGTSHNEAAPRFDTNTVFTQPFFPGISGGKPNVQATVAALRALVPQDEREVLARAAAAARGDIPLFGYGVLHLGPTPDWQRDPFANLRAPQNHWSTIPYLDRQVVGDHKVVWEINRHQYFVTFGQAFAYTGDERWPKAFVQMLDSWLDTNPPTIGMNWCSSLEVSYRAISWLWALQLMRDAGVVDTRFKARVLASLQAHGRHLERYLSTYFSPNTHLTGEALGLFYIGTQCPELPRARYWTALGASVLERALDRQILADGVYFEQATQYHRYTIDIYVHYALLAQAVGRSTARTVLPALGQMFDVLLHITRGDGTIPLIGDDDGGRLVQLDGRPPHDVRALLATGAVMLDRNDLAWVGRGDDAAHCWTLGSRASALRDAHVSEPPAVRARAFPEGGVFTMRDGWNDSSSVAVIDAGPHGALSYGHSHADALSVDLSVDGRPLLVDSGTYTYVGDERNAFRSTAAHNTVEIDGVSTSVPDTAFRWKKISNATATAWTTAADFSYFAGTHDGYRDLPDPVKHERAVLHNHEGLWVVRDAIFSGARHSAVLRWHCAPNVSPRAIYETAGQCQLVIDENSAARALLVMCGSAAGRMFIDDGWVSSQFGQKAAAKVCAWREPVNGNAVLASIVIDTARYAIAQNSGNGHATKVRGAAAVLALELAASASGASGEQLLVIVGNGSTITFNALEFEADIALLRVDTLTGRQLGLMVVPLLSPA